MLRLRKSSEQSWACSEPVEDHPLITCSAHILQIHSYRLHGSHPVGLQGSELDKQTSQAQRFPQAGVTNLPCHLKAGLHCGRVGLWPGMPGHLMRQCLCERPLRLPWRLHGHALCLQQRHTHWHL